MTRLLAYWRRLTHGYETMPPWWLTRWEERATREGRNG